MEMADLTENYQLKWHSFGTHLHSCVTASLQKETFSDVSLHTMDGHQISAHRFVLSASSQYLHEILKKQQRVNANLPLLIILPPEINYVTMKTLIQYMYSGETTISKDILESVLRGGDLLKVKGLWRPEEERQLDVNHTQPPEKDPSKYTPSKTPKIRLLDYKYDKNVTINSNKKEVAKTYSKVSSAVSSIINVKTPKAINREEIIQSVEVPNNLLQKTPTNAQEFNTGSDIIADNASSSNDNYGQFLVIKEEPIEWSELDNSEMEMINETEVFQDEMTIKPEVILDDSNENVEELYSPLTCELCSETFRLPAEWVRHIQTHTDMLPAKRQRRGKSTDDDGNATFPPLKCDMCQQHFPTPAEWVRHIQSAHTEFELRISNKSTLVKPLRINRQFGATHKICGICSKKFPSHASMLIHKRTHTGEKPYMCEHCKKGFNVKSNLLRHLRTLHDRIINSDEIQSKEGTGSGNSNS